MHKEYQKTELWFWIAGLVVICGALIALSFLVISTGHSLEEFLITIGIVGGLFISVPVAAIVWELKKLALPEQKTQALVLEKGRMPETSTNHPDAHVTFEFADGTRHKLSVSYKTFEMLHKNSTVWLYYKERKDRMWFVGFESADTQLLVDRPAVLQHILVGRKGSLWPRFVLLLLFALAFFVLPVIALLAAFKLLWPYCLVLFISCACLGFFLLAKLKKSLEAQERCVAATVLKKRKQDGVVWDVFFLFEDGETTSVHVHADLYALLARGDKGMLTYRQGKKAAWFITFERTE